MRTVTADEAFQDWRKLAAETRREPVKIVAETDEAMIVMSEGEYRRLKGQAWDRLFASMDKLAAEAAASGLTEEKLEELLADKS